MTRSGRIFEVLIIALPVVLIYLLWMSTSGAPQRFHMIIFGCYLTPSLIGLVLAKKNAGICEPPWLLICCCC